MTPEEFRRHAHAVVDLIADYRENIAARPVMSRAEPGDLRNRLPASPPEEAEPFESILGDIENEVMPALTHWQHPRFFGYFPSNAELASVLGDFLSTGFGVLGLSWQSSPALTELEEVVCDWMRQLLGLPDTFSGVIQDTASTSTLIALLSARERALDCDLPGGGLQSAKKKLTVYLSRESHSSALKAALLAGFGRAHVRMIEVDEAFAMRADALESALVADAAAGLTPCAIVATCGTTATTAMDPIRAIAERAAAHGAWLHVDAAMAGSSMLVPSMRPLWDGIERADSVVVNAHKWLGAVFDCSLYYVKDEAHLVRVMSMRPSYLATSVDDRVKNLRDWGIPLGRRFRALKLYCLLREQGARKLRERILRDLSNASALCTLVEATPRWRVLAPVVLQTVVVRHEPPGLDPEELDRHTLAWADRLNRSGEAYVTPAKVNGSWAVRVSIGALMTEREHVDALWTRMQVEVARAM